MYVSIHKNIVTTKSIILWILIRYEELVEFTPSDLLSMLQYNIYKTVWYTNRWEVLKSSSA